MALTINITEDDVFSALGSVLTTILPAEVVIIRGQVNRVADPIGPSFIMMNSFRRERLSTNIDSWAFDDPTPITMTTTADMAVTTQLDCHGPLGADVAAMLHIMIRGSYVQTLFRNQGSNMDGSIAPVGFLTPLYTTDPLQTPFLNGEQQYDDRWSIDLTLQLDPVCTIPQDFAQAAAIGLINVDATYPPGG